MATQASFLAVLKTTASNIARVGGKGSAKRQQSLRRELIDALATEGNPPSVCLQGIEARWDSCHIKYERARLCLFFTEVHNGTSQAVAARRLRMYSPILKWLNDFASLVPAPRMKRLAALGIEPVVLAQAVLDSRNDDVDVFLDPRAEDDLLLAALEAYAVGRPVRGGRHTETGGHIFGSLRVEPLPRGRTRTVIHVARITTQLRAVATASSLRLNGRSLAVHVLIASRLFPHLQCLGDYHTHPYVNVSALRRHHGWRPSDVDRKSWSGLVENSAANGSRWRVALVAAVTTGPSGRESRTRRAHNRHRIWIRPRNGESRPFCIELAAYRLDRDGTATDNLELHLIRTHA